MSSTIRDVAKRAGVALGTVSRYLNGCRLREDNKLKIEKAILELGFKENIIAKGLKNNRSMTIGVVIGSITDIFSTSIVSAVERVLEKENYSVILCDYEGKDDKLEWKLQFLLNRSVDGLILFAGDKSPGILEEYYKNGIPVVVLDHILPEAGVDTVLADNANASFRAAERLIHSGHKRIAIINGPENSYVSKERYRGFLEALNLYNLNPDSLLVKSGGFSSQGGYCAALELLKHDFPPTALYITNYYMTLGAMMAINELNIKIPDELSVIGFDHFELSDVIKPALTVIEQPVNEIGEIAGRIILKRLKGNYAGFPETHCIKTRMLVRDSIADINKT